MTPQRALEIKVDNIRDYIEECKGVIDAPTKLLLTNEVASLFLNSTADMPYDLTEDKVRAAAGKYIENMMDLYSEKQSTPVQNSPETR